MFCSGNGINTAFVPGMAATYSLDTKPYSTENTMMSDSLVGIAGTGRVEAALTPDIGAEYCLVGLDQEDQDLLHRFANSCQ